MTENNNSLLPTQNPAECFSAANLDNGCVTPNRKLRCSSTAGWTSLLVLNLESPARVEFIETLPSPDQLIVLNTKGEYEIESFSNGFWRKAVYRPGMGGMTAAGKTSRLRWQAKDDGLHQTLQVYIPQFFFLAAADEYRRAGTAFRLEQPDALSFCDPVVAQTVLSLNEAIKTGAPNLYAESAAQFLATHLLSMHSRWSEPATGWRKPGVIADRRLARVLEFMEHHSAENLTLAQLAGEAGVSRFHFINLFKKSCGVTPHQHLVRLRMKRAAWLLANTDLSLKEIAHRCGYANTAHLPTAFQKHFAQTPAEYRITNMRC